MNNTGTLALGIGLAAFVMIEIYNAATGVLLVVWLISKQNVEEDGFEQQQTLVELVIVRQGDDQHSSTKPNERLAIGCSLVIAGETVTSVKRPSKGTAAAAVITPPVIGQPLYRVYLPGDLVQGDELVVHLFELRPNSFDRCTVQWTISNPKRKKGEPEDGEFELTKTTPAVSLNLDGIDSSFWSPVWTNCD